MIADALRKSDAGLVEVQTLDVSIFLFLGQPLMANSQHPFFFKKQAQILPITSFAMMNG